MKDGIGVMMNALRDRSALSCLNAPDPPEIPRGNQTFKFEIGQPVYSSGLGPVKKGIAIPIVDRYEQHGYCYYVAKNGQVHREMDLTAQE